ncbi:MAG: ABC transporter substrate-binding protein [Synergistetes bacterium]|nr:ABC transporter substrate-binding protein [Synergistota bacterium]
MLKKIPLALSLIVGVLLALSVVSYASAVCLKDDLGEKVCFKSPPARVISLAPSITETIYAVGGEDRLVAVTNYANYPPAALKKKRVGGVWNPNKELIIYLRPDLVFGLANVHRKLFVYLHGLV